MPQYTGKVYIRLNGSLVESNKGATLNNPTGEERSDVVGTEVYGWAEKAVVPRIDFEILHGADVSVSDLWSFKEGTATFECDSGPVFILAPAWMSKVETLKQDDEGAKLSCSISAKRCTEQT